ncbi:MAG: hypothetical protein VX498_01765 [Myxococcota bacterium]|nr:hypothetical protein [Myxococcota bacterium]
MADILLSGSSWSPLDSFQGVLGGMFVTALVGLPGFFLFGISPFSTQALAYLGAAGLLLVVYRLVDRHESRSAALVAVAGLAFAPPILFHPSAVLGNWHWTQLLFDYGLLLFALELVSRRRPPITWALFGLAVGLAVFHCMGSLPFVGLSVLAALVLGRPGRGSVGFAAGLLVGLGPFIYKLLLHKPFGHPGDGSDQTLRRLTSPNVELGRLPDLIYPELPLGLHFHDGMEVWSASVGWGIALIWVGVAWLGLLLLVWSGLDRRRRLASSVESRLLTWAPVAFVLVFAAAYVCLPARMTILPDEFTNIRQLGHRNLPVLLAALVVGAAVGWCRLASSVGGRLRPALWTVALLPALGGLLGQLALVETQGPEEFRSFRSYRAACVDVLGVFAAASLRGHPWDAIAACDGLEGDLRQGQCRQGAAWGTGFGGGSLTSSVVREAAEGREASELVLTEEALSTCDRVPEDLLGECRFGVGWWVGQLNWGRDDWPIEACDSFAGSLEQEDCWRGVGFHVGDHLHPRPHTMGRLLQRVSPERSELVAEGAGIAIGRSYSEEAWASSFCDRMGGGFEAACRRGVQRSFTAR